MVSILIRIKNSFTKFYKKRTWGAVWFVVLGVIQFCSIIFASAWMIGTGLVEEKADHSPNNPLCCEIKDYDIPANYCIYCTNNISGCHNITTPPPYSFPSIQWNMTTDDLAAMMLADCACRRDPRRNDSDPQGTTLPFTCFYVDYRKMQAYGVIYILNGLFFGYYTVYGVVDENNYEVIASLATSAIVVYLSVQRCFISSWVPGNPDYIQFGVSSACLLLCMYCCWVMWPKFGWVMFQRVGAKPDIRKAYLNLRMLETFSKADVMVTLMLTIVIYFYLHYAGAPLTIGVLTGVLSVFCCVWEYWGTARALKRERRAISLVYLIGQLVTPTFYIICLVSYLRPTGFWEFAGTPAFPWAAGLATIVLVFACRAVVLILGVYQVKMFGTGLARVLQGDIPTSGPAIVEMRRSPLMVGGSLHTSVAGPRPAPAKGGLYASSPRMGKPASATGTQA